VLLALTSLHEWHACSTHCVQMIFLWLLYNPANSKIIAGLGQICNMQASCSYCNAPRVLHRIVLQ
jgi:hypothetical protein